MRVLFALLFAAFTVPLFACSICHCGDPSQIARGGDQCACENCSSHRIWTAALDFRTMATSSGELPEETHIQNQVGLGVYRRFLSSAFVFARVPFTMNRLETEGSEPVDKRGLGDSELLFGNSWHHSAGGFQPSLTLGVKIPTGNNALTGEAPEHHHHTLDSDDETRLPEHAQIGTGSFDSFAMLNLHRAGSIAYSATFGFRMNGENKFDFHYGNVGWFDLDAARKLNNRVDLKIGSRVRFAEKDSDHNLADDESGGFLAAALLGGNFSFTRVFRFNVNAAIPVVNQLNGTQSEQVSISAGITQSF